MDLLNLQRMSAISLASTIWKTPDIQKLIKDLFNEESKRSKKCLKKTWMKYFPPIIDQPQDISPLGDSLAPLCKDIETAFLKVRVTEADDEHKENLKNFQIIIYSVLQRLQSLPLPSKLKIYCQQVAAGLGEKIFNWLNLLARELFEEDDEEFSTIESLITFSLTHIYWTSYGTLDKNKILKMWQNDGEFQTYSFEGNKDRRFSKWRDRVEIACLNVEKEFILVNQEEIESIFEEDFICSFDLRRYDDKVYTLLALGIYNYQYYGFRTNLFQDIEPDLENTKYVIKPDVMVRICAYAGIKPAASYFWNIVKDFTDDQFLLEICELIFQEPDMYDDLKVYEDRVETLIFFINQMQPELRSEFMRNNVFRIFWLILPEWPFNETVIFKLIDNYFTQLSNDDCENIFTRIFELLNFDDHYVFSKIEFYNRLLRKIFASMTPQQISRLFEKDNSTIFEEVICKLEFSDLIFELIDNYFPPDFSCEDFDDVFYKIFSLIKRNKSICFQTKYLEKIFEKFYELLNVDLIDENFYPEFYYTYVFNAKCFNLVLRNKDEEFRLKVIQKIPFRTFFLDKEGSIEQLDQFMNDVLISDVERKFYKEHLFSQIDDLISDAAFDEINKLFKYFRLSAKEITAFKSKINCVKFCEELIADKYRYDKAEKLLEWVFPDREKRDRFRYSLDDKCFVFNQISKSSSDILEIFIKTEKNRGDFVKFFFGSRKEKASVKNASIYCKIPSSLEYTLMDHLPSFSGRRYTSLFIISLPLEIRRNLNSRFSRIDNFYNYCLFDENKMDNVFMKWFCKDEKRRTYVMKSYDSKRRLLFRKLVFISLSF